MEDGLNTRLNTSSNQYWGIWSELPSVHKWVELGNTFQAYLPLHLLETPCRMFYFNSGFFFLSSRYICIRDFGNCKEGFLVAWALSLRSILWPFLSGVPALLACRADLRVSFHSSAWLMQGNRRKPQNWQTPPLHTHSIDLPDSWLHFPLNLDISNHRLSQASSYFGRNKHSVLRILEKPPRTRWPQASPCGVGRGCQLCSQMAALPWSVLSRKLSESVYTSIHTNKLANWFN